MSKNRSNAVLKTEAAPVTEAPVAEVKSVEVPAPAATIRDAAAAAPAPQVTETAEQLIAKYGNKSNAIRAMAAEGLKCGPISKALGIRYQHARNVLNQPLKRVIKEERDAAKVETKEPAGETA